MIAPCYQGSAMGQILVRNLDDAVIKRLKSRAIQRGESLEQTVREIIAEAVGPTREEAWAEIDRIRAMTPRKLESSVPLIRAFRDGDDPDS
jgi:plasmid stability protein